MNSSGIIQDTLHYELLRKFRTGNVIIDSFLHIFALGFLLNFITSSINAIHISYIFECFDDLPLRRGYGVVFENKRQTYINKCKEISWKDVAFLSTNSAYNLRSSQIISQFT